MNPNETTPSGSTDKPKSLSEMLQAEISADAAALQAHYKDKSTDPMGAYAEGKDKSYDLKGKQLALKTLEKHGGDVVAAMTELQERVDKELHEENKRVPKAALELLSARSAD